MLKIALTWSWSIPIYWYLKSTNNDRHILHAWLNKNYRSPGMSKVLFYRQAWMLKGAYIRNVGVNPLIWRMDVLPQYQAPGNYLYNKQTHHSLAIITVITAYNWEITIRVHYSYSIRNKVVATTYVPHRYDSYLAWLSLNKLSWPLPSCWVCRGRSKVLIKLVWDIGVVNV